MTSETGENLDKALGTEIDVVLNYGLTKVINLEGGFSTMFSTPTMASAKVKNITNADDVSTWAYLMISIKPDMLTANQK